MEYYFTAEQLKGLQSKSFEEKVQISITKILEIINRTNGQIYVAFSGGKDSSVLLDLTAKIWAMTKYSAEPLNVALANTTCEYNGMLKFAHDFIGIIEERHGIKINFLTTHPDKKIKDIFIDEGYPVVSKTTARKISDVRKIMDEKNISWDDIKEYLDATVENAEYLRKLGFNDSTTAVLCGILSTNKKASSMTRIPRRWLPLLYAPFKVSPKCCDYLKKSPFKKIADQLNMSVLLGEMAEESKIRENAYKKNRMRF